MLPVAALLLTLLRTSSGAVTACDGRVNGTLCHGRLGGTVCLHLKKSPSDVYRFTLKLDGQEIFKVTNGKVTKNLTITRFTYFFNNGTFCINNLNRSDSGFYKLFMYDSNGRDVGDLISHLSVEAPVSSVSLVLSLSKGELSVSCSAEGGDSPLYNWTLDGRSLTTHKFILEDEKPNTIILKKQSVSGRLNCSARNNVSSVSRVLNLSSSDFIFIDCIANGTKISEWVLKENNTLCVETTTEASTVGKETYSLKTSAFNTPHNQNGGEPWYIRQLPVLIGVLSALLIFLLIGVTVICVKNKKTAHEERDKQDLTYADVRIVKRQCVQMERSKEEDVEYGQVKFRERPSRSETTADECVYARVKKPRQS